METEVDGTGSWGLNRKFGSEAKMKVKMKVKVGRGQTWGGSRCEEVKVKLKAELGSRRESETGSHTTGNGSGRLGQEVGGAGG